MRGFLIRTLVGCLLLCSLVSVSSAETIAIIQGVTANTTSAWIDVSGYQLVQMQAWSSAGSGVIVNVECSSDPTGAINLIPSPPFPCSSTVNPNSTQGEYWNEPRAHFVRINVNNYGSGTIYVNLDRYIK